MLPLGKMNRGLRMAYAMSAFPVPRSSRTKHGFKLILDPRNRWIDWNLVVHREYEPGTLRLVDLFVSEAGTFVDVGANIGLISAYAAQRVGKRGRVFSFEPDLINFSRLVWSRSVNDLPQMIPLPFAVGDKAGMAQIFRSRSNDGGLSSLLSLQDFIEGGNVTTVTLDSLFEALPPCQIDLIKIDVEGFEEYVVSGARAVLNSHKPPITMEMTNENAVVAGEYLLGLGYDAFLTDGKSSPEIKALQSTHPRILESDNMLFVHNSQTDRIHSMGLAVIS